VLLNVLSNAVKYNRDAGSIRVSAEDAGAGRLRIVISDTGAGIAPARMNELFQPFSRLDAEQSEVEGTGIGLTITRRLMELMGGEIGVSSELGVGSTFWLDLASEVPPGVADAAREAAGEVAALATRALRVLCIDDNPTNLKLVKQMLGRRPHIGLLASHNPELALELARGQRPNLILLDINMPGIDGYQVLALLRAQPALAAIPVIAITANAMLRDIERGRTAGFAAYLTKPLDVGLFLHTVDRCLAPTEENPT
jgi:CheY-like chemotaxis protein